MPYLVNNLTNLAEIRSGPPGRAEVGKTTPLGLGTQLRCNCHRHDDVLGLPDRALEQSLDFGVEIFGSGDSRAEVKSRFKIVLGPR
jgi:hypothetical protein